MSRASRVAAVTGLAVVALAGYLISQALIPGRQPQTP